MRAKFISILLVAALLGLGGCSSLDQSGFKLGDGKIGSFDPLASLDDFLQHIRTFAAADVKHAYEMAAKDNDQVAAICWQVTSVFLQPPLEDDKSSDKTIGLATVIQSVRHAKTTVGGGVPSELRIACAALYNDIRRDALAIAALAASRGAIKLPTPAIATKP